MPRIDLAIGAPLRVHIRARDVMIGLKPPEELSALNMLPGRIAEVGALDGPIVDVRIDANGAALVARVTRLTIDRLGLVPGRPVFAIIKSIALDRRSLGQGQPVSDKVDVDEITL